MRAVFVLLVFFLVGCASVESTALYYIPSTTEIYPPKPKDDPVPVVGERPSEPHQVIGRLAFSSTRGFDFFLRSMEYNARRVGADLVYLKHSATEPLPYSYWVPPRTRFVPVGGATTVRKKDGERVTYRYWRDIPVFEPGYVVRGVDLLTSIDAEMIVLKDSSR